MRIQVSKKITGTFTKEILLMLNVVDTIIFSDTVDDLPHLLNASHHYCAQCGDMENTNSFTIISAFYTHH